MASPRSNPLNILPDSVKEVDLLTWVDANPDRAFDPNIVVNSRHTTDWQWQAVLSQIEMLAGEGYITKLRQDPAGSFYLRITPRGKDRLRSLQAADRLNQEEFGSKSGTAPEENIKLGSLGDSAVSPPKRVQRAASTAEAPPANTDAAKIHDLWVMVANPDEDARLNSLSPGSTFEYAVPRGCAKGDWLLTWVAGGVGFLYICRATEDVRAPLADEYGPAQANLEVIARLQSPISFRMLAQNDVLSKWNLVRSNMQGAVQKQHISLLKDSDVWRALRQLILENNPDCAELLLGITHNATQSFEKQDRRNALDLTTFGFSPAVWEVLNLAKHIRRIGKEDVNRISSSPVFFALVELGRRSQGVPSEKTLLFDSLSMNREWMRRYESELGAYCNNADTLSTLPLTDKPISELTPVTSNVKSWLTQSEEIKNAVTEKELDVQHLLVPLLLGDRWNAQKKLIKSGLDQKQLREELYRTIATARPHDNLREWHHLLFGTDVDLRQILPSYISDTVDEETVTDNDPLNIRRDIQAFASLIAAKNLAPPLSIGLFGEWGSGKSYFMAKLRAEVDDLTKSTESDWSDQLNDSKKLPFCSGVVQIPFNAWHYVDDSLWASLVTEIFDNLLNRISIEKKISDEDAHALVQNELVKAQGLFKEAQEELKAAQSERDNAELALKTLRKTREAKEQKISARLDDVMSLLRADPQAQLQLKSLSDTLGITEAAKSFKSLENQVSQLQSFGKRTAAVASTIFQSPGRTWRLVTLCCAIMVPIAIGLFSAHARSWVTQIAVKLAAWSSLCVTLSAWFAKQLDRGNKAINSVELLYSQLQDIREKRMLEGESQERAEVETLRQRELAAQKKVTDNDLRIQTLERELAELKPGRRLQRFIQERSRAAEYKEQLGLLSLIRQDFMTLSDFLDKRVDLPIDRIVLYIDDLDRCPPKRVVEVLEAIHLLLAFKLFVVVVGVDVRWISRSLLDRYQSLLLDDGVKNPIDSVASPHDYLEKIFQIPFWIRPIDRAGSEKLLADLLLDEKTSASQPYPRSVTQKNEGSDEVRKQLKSTDQEPESKQIDQHQPSTPATIAEVNDKSIENFKPGKDTNHETSDVAESETSGINAKQLTIEPLEVEFMQGVAEFIGTSPRRIKRFVNIYRLLKASVPPDELSTFFISSSHSKEFQAVIVLLAILTGSPNVAPGVLHNIARSDSRASVEEFKTNLGKDDATLAHGDYSRVSAILNYYQSKKGVQVTLADLKRWAPKVARYSFRWCA
jgi:hypothetical protein